jgi:hypothetical protein
VNAVGVFKRVTRKPLERTPVVRKLDADRSETPRVVSPCRRLGELTRVVLEVDSAAELERAPRVLVRRTREVMGSATLAHMRSLASQALPRECGDPIRRLLTTALQDIGREPPVSAARLETADGDPVRSPAAAG